MAEDCILKQAILKLFVTLNGEFCLGVHPSIGRGLVRLQRRLVEFWQLQNLLQMISNSKAIFEKK